MIHCISVYTSLPQIISLIYLMFIFFRFLPCRSWHAISLACLGPLLGVTSLCPFMLYLCNTVFLQLVFPSTSCGHSVVHSTSDLTWFDLRWWGVGGGALMWPNIFPLGIRDQYSSGGNPLGARPRYGSYWYLGYGLFSKIPKCARGHFEMQSKNITNRCSRRFYFSPPYFKQIPAGIPGVDPCGIQHSHVLPRKQSFLFFPPFFTIFFNPHVLKRTHYTTRCECD